MNHNRLLRLFIVIMMAALVVGCTFMYQRRYVVEPEEQLTLVEQRAVFESFKVFLIEKGLKPLPERQGANTSSVAFRIGSGATGMLTRSPFSDILELRYVEGSNFELRLERITSHPVDFSEKGLATFVSESESFIQQASSKRVRLRSIPLASSPSFQRSASGAR